MSLNILFGYKGKVAEYQAKLMLDFMEIKNEQIKNEIRNKISSHKFYFGDFLSHYVKEQTFSNFMKFYPTNVRSIRLNLPKNLETFNSLQSIIKVCLIKKKIIFNFNYTFLTN